MYDHLDLSRGCNTSCTGIKNRWHCRYFFGSYYLCITAAHVFGENSAWCPSPIEGTLVVMPIHCIVHDFAHYNSNKQQTFRSAYDCSYHWDKCHQDILRCFLASDPHYLTFLGLVKKNLRRHTGITHAASVEKLFPMR